MSISISISSSSTCQLSFNPFLSLPLSVFPLFQSPSVLSWFILHLSVFLFCRSILHLSINFLLFVQTVFSAVSISICYMLICPATSCLFLFPVSFPLCQCQSVLHLLINFLLFVQSVFPLFQFLSVSCLPSAFSMSILLLIQSLFPVSISVRPSTSHISITKSTLFLSNFQIYSDLSSSISISKSSSAIPSLHLLLDTSTLPELPPDVYFSKPLHF